MPPTFGTSEVQGAVQWKWSLLLQQTVFIQYCTSDWISTPLTLVDTCQVNDIWKDAWVNLCFHGPPSLGCCIIHIYMPNRTGRYTKYGVLLLILSLTMIHNTIGLGLPIFLLMRQPVSRQQISIYSTGPYWYMLACTPTFGKVGVQKNFSLAPLANPVLYPHLKIRGAAPVWGGWSWNKKHSITFWWRFESGSEIFFLFAYL